MKTLRKSFNSSYAIAFDIRVYRDDYLVKGFMVSHL